MFLAKYVHKRVYSGSFSLPFTILNILKWLNLAIVPPWMFSGLSTATARLFLYQHSPIYYEARVCCNGAHEYFKFVSLSSRSHPTHPTHPPTHPHRDPHVWHIWRRPHLWTFMRSGYSPRLLGLPSALTSPTLLQNALNFSNNHIYIYFHENAIHSIFDAILSM